MQKYFQKIGLIVFLSFLWTAVAAQVPGDYDYVYTSLEKAKENPTWVNALDLSGKRLKNFPNGLSQFPNMRTLNLSQNKISLLPAVIGELTQLEELDLSKNKLGVIPPQIGKLKELQKLNLAKNSIRNIPDEIGKLNQLKELDLWLNKIKNIPAEMNQLHQLKYLNLRGNVLPEELEENLKKWLPNTNIQFAKECRCGL